MRATGIALAAVLLVLSGCQKKADAAHTIHDSMAEVMEPSAEAIWDTMSKGYNDKGDALDPAKFSEGDWKAMVEASAKMLARAQELANSERHVVAAAGVQIMGAQAAGQVGPSGADWDAVDAKTVQARVDANPPLFKEKALALVDAASKINRAATSKDTALLYHVASELDEVCDSCHEPFWGTDVPPPVPSAAK